MRLSVIAASAFVCLAIGCGNSENTGTASDALTVHGTVPRTTLLTDNAKAIAVSPAGHVYTAYLNRQGGFTLQLPTGHAYRVLIANTLPSGRHEVIGRLTLANRSTGTSAWLGARSAGNIDLGELHMGSADGLKIQCGCSSGSGGSGGVSGGDSSGDDHNSGGSGSGGGDSNAQGDDNDDQGGGDYSCHEDDGEKGSMCSGGSGGSDLHAQNDPGSKCDDSDLDDDQDKNEDDGPSCSGKGSGGDDNDQGENNNDQGQNKDTQGQSGGGSASGSDSSGSGSSGSGSSCGCQAQGNPCNCASDCQTGQACVAGHCTK
jgi:hypothetical protein